MKFFGELLATINRETQVEDLRKSANEFGLHWTSSDQINRRVSWLQSLGLLERWRIGHWQVTELGERFLREATLCTPAEAMGMKAEAEAEAHTLPEIDPELSSLLALDTVGLRARKTLIGYIPRGQNKPDIAEASTKSGLIDSIRFFVDMVDEESSTDELFQRAILALGQKKSSFTQSMHTFRNMGMIDTVALNRYGRTRAAYAYLEPGNEVGLVRYLHSRYRFIGELLSAIHETTTVSELVGIAKSRYQCANIDSAEVRARLSIMLDAGLVKRIDWTRYRSTATGKALAAQLPLETAIESDLGLEPESDNGSGAEHHHDTDELLGITRDLRAYSGVADASTEFERTVARAFHYFGFRAEHIGGSGKTDVLVSTELAASEMFRATVDAKASSSGVISDNAIKFDALKDHLQKHDAKYGAVVGPGFTNRVQAWAESNGFRLLTVEELIDLLTRHHDHPVSVVELRQIFEQPGQDLSELAELYDAAENRAVLLTRLIDALFQEGNEEDPVADGFMSLENLYYVLRKEVVPRPSQGTVEACLQFLTTNLVRAAERTGDKYKLIDAPRNIARRLRGLGLGLPSLSAG
ncbi:hypothetical protein [Amycolatopsis sp. GA6-003]|uniref:hypothetical protein n=1 Tax=Amycolatopsis sp. GA6-003 TaxID=2652444 RepID=UPI0039176402